MNKLVADLLNGFSLNDIPLFLIQVLAAAFLCFLLGMITRSDGTLTIIGATVAVITIIAKNSIPVSILFAAVLIPFVYRKMVHENEGIRSDYAVLAAIGAGVGCGSGSVFLTSSAYLLIILPIAYFAGKK